MSWIIPTTCADRYLWKVHIDLAEFIKGRIRKRLMTVSTVYDLPCPLLSELRLQKA